MIKKYNIYNLLFEDKKSKTVADESKHRLSTGGFGGGYAQAVCAFLFESEGWTVESVAGTSSHAEDVVVSKGSITLTIECKAKGGTFQDTAFANAGSDAKYQNEVEAKIQDDDLMFFTDGTGDKGFFLIFSDSKNSNKKAAENVIDSLGINRGTTTKEEYASKVTAMAKGITDKSKPRADFSIVKKIDKNFNLSPIKLTNTSKGRIYEILYEQNCKGKAQTKYRENLAEFTKFSADDILKVQLAVDQDGWSQFPAVHVKTKNVRYPYLAPIGQISRKLKKGWLEIGASGCYYDPTDASWHQDRKKRHKNAERGLAWALVIESNFKTWQTWKGYTVSTSATNGVEDNEAIASTEDETTATTNPNDLDSIENNTFDLNQLTAVKLRLILKSANKSFSLDLKGIWKKRKGDIIEDLKKIFSSEEKDEIEKLLKSITELSKEDKEKIIGLISDIVKPKTGEMAKLVSQIKKVLFGSTRKSFSALKNKNDAVKAKTLATSLKIQPKNWDGNSKTWSSTIKSISGGKNMWDVEDFDPNQWEMSESRNKKSLVYALYESFGEEIEDENLSSDNLDDILKLLIQNIADGNLVIDE